MNNYIEIIKKDLGFYTDIRAMLKNKSTSGKMISSILLGVIILIYLFIGQKFLMNTYDVFIELGMYNELLSLAFFIFISLVIIFFTARLVSQLYYSNDMKILLRLPFTSKGLLASKIISSNISALFYSLLITVPIIIRIGIKSNQNILFYIKSIIGLLFISVVSISILMFLIVFVMRFVSKSARMKKVLQYVSYIVFIIFIIGIQFTMNSFMMNFSPERLIDITSNSNNIINTILPQIRLANAFILSSGFSQLILLLIILASMVLIPYIIVAISHRTFISGVTDSGSHVIRKSKSRKSDRESSVFKELFIKELKNIFGNSGYMINKFAFGIILPIAMILPVFLQEEISFSTMNDSIRLYIGTLKTNMPLFISLLIGITAIIAIFISTGSELTSSTFSREGRNIWLVKSLPINVKDQLLSRLLASVVMILLSSLPIITVLIYIVGFNLIYTLLILLVYIIIASFMSLIYLIVGFYITNTEWDNPLEAIKSFRNILMPLIGLGIASLLGLSTYAVFELNPDVFLFMVIIWLVAILILIYILYKLSEKIYVKKVHEF